jgi:integrase
VYLKKHSIEADSYVFQNKKGGAYQSMTFRKQMIKYCCELGIKDGEYLFRSHDYRHGVATRFYDSGVSIQGVRDYLGHAYEEMTRQYIDYMPERLDRASGEFFTKPGNSLMACLKGGGD